MSIAGPPPLVTVSMVLLLTLAGCKQQATALPLSLEAVEQLSQTNTAEISFEDTSGEIEVTVTDLHGDTHRHKLAYDGVIKRQAMEILRKKQAELQARCRLPNIGIVKGMPRITVENLVAQALDARSTYSPFANNLVGGTVKYQDADCILSITYAPGAPAPITRTANDGAEHLPPRDEEVLEIQLAHKLGNARPPSPPK